MRIRWHGHACFEIENELLVVTDPHDGKSIGIKPPQVTGDVILVSHDHFDHNASRLVMGSNSELVEEPGKHRFGDLEIEGFPTYHDEQDGDIRGENIIYKFTTNGVTFCHLGDLGHIPDKEILDELTGIDFLFIPVGGTFTIGNKKAAELVEMIKPKVAIPMHFKTAGLSLNLQRVTQFLSHFDEEMTHKVGVELDFIHDDLPSGTEIWLFSI